MQQRFKKYFRQIATLLALCLALSSPAMAMFSVASPVADDMHCQHLQHAAQQGDCQQDCCAGAACATFCTVGTTNGMVAAVTVATPVSYYHAESSVSPAYPLLQGIAGVVELHPPR